MPCCKRCRILGRQSLPCFQHPQHLARRHGFSRRQFRALLDLGLRQFLQRQLDCLVRRTEISSHLLKRPFRDARHLLPKGPAVPLGEGHRTARGRIRVRSAAAHEHGVSAGEPIFEIGLCESGVVAGDHVVRTRKRRVVAGGAEQERKMPARGCSRRKHRNRPVRPALRVVGHRNATVPRQATVHRKGHASPAPAELCGLQLRNGVANDGNQPVLERPRVRNRLPPVVGRKRCVGDRIRLGPRIQADQRAGVAVRRVEQQLRSLQTGLLANAVADRLRDDRRLESDQIGRDDDSPSAAAVFKGERFRVDVLRNVFERLRAVAVAQQDDGLLGCDRHASAAHSPLGVLLGFAARDRSSGNDQRKQQPFHEAAPILFRPCDA